MKTNTLDRSIKDALGAGFYEIPRFQRPYSWDTARNWRTKSSSNCRRFIRPIANGTVENFHPIHTGLLKAKKSRSTGLRVR